MGYNGKLELKQKAQQLRKEGLSYKEILAIVKVSKDTVSRWCRHILLSSEQRLRLDQSKKDGGLRGSIIGARKQLQQRVERTTILYKQGIEEVGKLNKRERFIAGVALYAGEGTKTDKVCEFVNADPELIVFMCAWFREFGRIPDSQFRGALWIHEELDQEKALDFWSNLTKIPKNQFHKTYIAINKNSSRKVRKHIHAYGVFSIRVQNSAFSRRIIGWIAGLLGEKWYNNRIKHLNNPL